ncbi:MAG: VCBS repeat-containing protein [Myxococcales bacterium]|nr:VCBS repeat-containing protein [Myxococcales bacterium]
MVNYGTGDWAAAQNLFADNSLAEASDDLLQTLHFFDYNNDRLIDIVRTTGAEGNTIIYQNIGSDFEVDDGVESIGAGFDSDTLELNDINGDGLLDAVQVQQTSVRYRLNLGWGRWSDAGEDNEWRTIEATDDMNLNEDQRATAEMEDLNGDAMADLVLVEGSTVRVWINRNGETFDAEQTISAGDGLDFPERLSTTTVLFADMNGNGSSDVVWITQNGDTTYLELFPVRPNLLSRIENGLGMVTDVTYGTSVEHMARDGGAGSWDYRVPFPMIVVDRLDEWDRLTEVHQIVDYTYHDGFYDGVEKQFRGFEEVTETTLGDESIADGTVDYFYDVGVGSHCRAGLILELDQISDGEVLFSQKDTHANCEVAEVDQEEVLYEVQNICLIETEVVVREGADQDDWVTQAQTWEYDGYGQVTRHIDHGQVAIGESSSCGTCDRAAGEYGLACGEGCLGDEEVTLTDYVTPGSGTGGRWVIGLEWRQRIFASEADAASESGRYQEIRTYYDGDDFVGLEEGQATLGFATRMTQRSSEDHTIEVMRARRDEHGNSVEEITPLGEIGGNEQIRRYEMTDDGLRVAAVEMLLGDRGDGDELIRQEVRYDQTWDKPSSASLWTLYQDGSPIHDVPVRGYGYDNFGRMVFETAPGDSAESPTTEYTWTLGDRFSFITTSHRSTSGGAFDAQQVECYDGRGRFYQTREMLGDDEWLVSGFEVYNLNGNEREVYQPYVADSGECDEEPPAGVLATTFEYDSLGRLTAINEVDGAREVIVYEPMRQINYDENDLDESSDLYDTPTIRLVDGLERTVATGRTDLDGDVEWFTYTYDSTGGIARLTDPMGNERTQTFDLLRQPIAVDDPDRGVTTWVYNDSGDVIEETNAAGETLVYEYDGANRLVRAFSEDDPSGAYYEITWDYDDECGSFCSNGSNDVVAVRFPTPDGDGVEFRQLDSRGNLTGLRRVIGDVTMDRIMTFDNLGRLLTQTFPGDYTLTYEFDAGGYIRGIPGILDAVEYDDRGDISRVEMANGVVNEVYVDDRRRLMRYAITDAEGSPIVERALTVDAAGLLLAIDDLAEVDGVPSANAAYEYDGFERLTSAVFGDDETVTYSYDAADNILSRTSSLAEESPVHDGTRVLDEDHAHQVLEAGAMTYAYDAAGRVTMRGEADLSWDAFDRHTASYVDGDLVVEHAYIDEDSRAMTRTADSVIYYHGEDFEVLNGVASFTVGIGGSSIARVEYPDFATEMFTDASDNGRIDAGDAWLALADDLDIIESDVALSDTGDLLASASQLGLIGYEERKTFLHRDHLDTVVAVSDEDGNIVERQLVYPYGSQRWSSTNNGEPSSFTDKRTDPSSDLVLIGLREYDPHAGRWISPDVAFSTIGVDEIDVPWEAMGNYIYAQNSPINLQDDDGARSWAKWAFGGGFGSASAFLGGAVGFALGGPPGAVIGALIGAGVGGGLGYLGGWLLDRRSSNGPNVRGAAQQDAPVVNITAGGPVEDSAQEAAGDVAGVGNFIDDDVDQGGDDLVANNPLGEGERNRAPSVYPAEGAGAEGAGPITGGGPMLEQGINLAEIMEDARMVQTPQGLPPINEDPGDAIGADAGGGSEESFGDALENAAVGMDAILDDIVQGVDTPGGDDGGGDDNSGGLPRLAPGQQDAIAEGRQ